MDEDEEGTECDLHIWFKPETENMTALYTISNGKYALCIEMPIEMAMDVLREHLEEMAEG